MRNNCNLIFVLVLGLSLININSIECHSFDDSINRIIDKHYARLISNLKSELPDQLRDFEEDISKQPPVTPLKGYKCQHDHVSETVPEIIYERLQINSNNNNNTNSNLKTIRSISEAQEVGKIRITFDTSLLEVGADKDYTCYNVGDKVKVDTVDPTNTKCTMDGVSPCMFTCTTGYLLTSSLQSLLKNTLIQTISEILTEVISVERVQGNLILDKGPFSTCHYGVPFPASTQTTGIADSDYHVFVTARPTANPDTIAYAKACVYPYGVDVNDSPVYGRPLAGIINFNPDYFTPFVSNPSGFTFREYTRVGLHEMIHALGFSSSLYRNYLDTNGAKFSPPPGSAYKFQGRTPGGTNYNTTKTLMTTPTVADFARGHYACDDENFGYQELENVGGAGTAASHWEKRSTGEELMLGYVQPMFPLTNLTLSLLQDTGWYQIDFSFADQLLWGKNLGCEWVADCTAESWNYPGYFCTSSKDTCSPTRAGKGSCNLLQYTQNLYYQYQHFENPYIGGVDSISDFCPYSIEKTYCQDESKQNSANTAIGESYSMESRCFEYNYQNQPQEMACLKQRCNGENIEIQVSGSWYGCKEGDTLTVGDFKIPCPTFYYPCIPSGVKVLRFNGTEVSQSTRIQSNQFYSTIFSFIIVFILSLKIMI